MSLEFLTVDSPEVTCDKVFFSHFVRRIASAGINFDVVGRSLSVASESAEALTEWSSGYPSRTLLAEWVDWAHQANDTAGLRQRSLILVHAAGLAWLAERNGWSVVTSGLRKLVLTMLSDAALVVPDTVASLLQFFAPDVPLDRGRVIAAPAKLLQYDLPHHLMIASSYLTVPLGSSILESRAAVDLWRCIKEPRDTVDLDVRAERVFVLRFGWSHAAQVLISPDQRHSLLEEIHALKRLMPAAEVRMRGAPGRIAFHRLLTLHLACWQTL